jgi:hypothetical protein
MYIISFSFTLFFPFCSQSSLYLNKPTSIVCILWHYLISMSWNSPHISNLNAFITNASPSKKAFHSLSKRLGAAAFYTLAKTHLNAKIFFISLHKINCWLYNLGTILLNETCTQKNRYNNSLHSIAKINQQLFSFESIGLFTSVPASNPSFPINFTSLRQTQAAFLYLIRASFKNIAKALKNKQPINPCTVLLKYYHQFLFAFNVTIVNTLPSYYNCNYNIKLKPGTISLFSLLYNILIKKL